jgi:SAM-dependent methyltransferase
MPPSTQTAPPAEILALCERLSLLPPPLWLAAEGTARGLPLPWWAKLGAKLLLARLPISYRAWARLGLFRHGQGAKAIAPRLAVFRHHESIYATRCPAHLARVVELGPGDSLATAVLAHAVGAEAILIDAGDFATGEPAHYRSLAEASGAEATVRAVAQARDRQAMLAAVGGRYETCGLAALAAVPNASVDLVFSNAVLEHVARSEVACLFRETARVLRPGGIASHGIDLHDHLGGGLNHLRFSARRWEGGFFRNSGFYTNRLPFSAYIEAARAAGLAIEIPWLRGWQVQPQADEAIHPDERHVLADERRIAAFGLILRKHAEGG